MTNQGKYTERAIRDVVSGSLRHHLDLPDGATVDLDTSFTDLGLDSTGVHGVTGDLEAVLGVRVPPEALFDYPSVRKLTRHLMAACAGVTTAQNWLPTHNGWEPTGRDGPAAGR